MSENNSVSVKCRSCPICKTRMSSRDNDPHSHCVGCRGKSCAFDDRCDVCIEWDDDKMNSYLKHQRRLENKRRSKEKKKNGEVPDPFLSCTGGGGGNSVYTSSENGSIDGDAKSSVQGSANSISLKDVEGKIASSNKCLELKMDGKFTEFGESVIEQVRSEFRLLTNDLFSQLRSNPSLSDPSHVERNRPRRSTPPPRLDHPCGSVQGVTAGDGSLHGREVPPQSLSDPTEETLRSVDEVRSLFHSGHLKPEEFNLLRDRIFKDQIFGVSPERKRQLGDRSPKSGVGDRLPRSQDRSSRNHVSSQEMRDRSHRKGNSSGDIRSRVRSPRKSPRGGSSSRHVSSHGTPRDSRDMSPQVSHGMSPGGSPQMSPGRSPQRSPPPSPQGTPLNSPGRSPHMSPRMSPHMSPHRSSQDRSELGHRGRDKSPTHDPSDGRDFLTVFDAVVGYFPEARDTSQPEETLSFVKKLPSVHKRSPHRFVLFDQIQRLRSSIVDKVNTLGKEGRRPSAVLHTRRPAYRPPSGEPSISYPTLNDSLSRLTTSRMSSSSSVNISAEEVRHLMNGFSSMLDTQSFAMWLISTLYSLVHDESFDTSDLHVFDSLFHSLSLAMEDQ